MGIGVSRCVAVTGGCAKRVKVDVACSRLEVVFVG